MIKVCPKCQIRPREMVSRLRSYCKECDRAWWRSWSNKPEIKDRIAKASSKRYYSNPERRRKLSREWYRANTDKRRNYCLKNKERIRLRYRESYGANPSIWADRTRLWRSRNPDQIRSLVRGYRSRKRLAAGTHDSRDIQRLQWFQAGLCYYCRKPLYAGYHVDHMVPLSRGGENGPENICLSCGSCNDSKHAKTATEFLSIIERVG